MVLCAGHQCGCGTYLLVDRWNLSAFNNWAIQGYSGCPLQWMALRAMRRRMSIALLGEQAAPTNLQAGGYYGVMRSGQCCMRLPRGGL